MPLVHPAGHAQADFGEAWAVLGGVRRKVHVLVVDLPQSDAIFLKAYLFEAAEALCDGHVAAFDFFGGVPQSILYDNTKLAVAKILGDGTRTRTRAKLFAELQSHYLFRDRFGRPGKGNDKGNVEGMVGFGRRTFMVPIPESPEIDALNAMLLERCRARQDAVLRGPTARSARGWRRTGRRSPCCRRRRSTPATSAPGRSPAKRWCATRTPTTRSAPLSLGKPRVAGRFTPLCDNAFSGKGTGRCSVGKRPVIHAAFSVDARASPAGRHRHGRSSSIRLMR